MDQDVPAPQRQRDLSYRKRQKKYKLKQSRLEADQNKDQDNDSQQDKEQRTSYDPWKPIPIEPGDMKNPLVEESSFATLFPKYREKYIKEVWTVVKKSLHEKGIKAELDLIEGSMTVKTTKKTWDPYAIIKARDVIKLLARSVPYQSALRVLEDECYCDIIKIRGSVSNREKFVKRRQRLVGPNGNTLKALELLTDCYIMVQGSTVSVIGHYKKLKTVRRIIMDTMKNVHPIYHIKELMIKRELEKDDKLKNENWERFLPNFKKQTNKLKRKKVPIKQKKQTDDLNMPVFTPRKIDIEMETGEYFLSKEEKDKLKMKRDYEKRQDGIMNNKELQERKENKERERQKKMDRLVEPGIQSEVQKEMRKEKLKSVGEKGKDQSLDVLTKKFKINSKFSLK